MEVPPAPWLRECSIRDFGFHALPLPLPLEPRCRRAIASGTRRTRMVTDFIAGIADDPQITQIDADFIADIAL
jgi:hypothetical protein